MLFIGFAILPYPIQSRTTTSIEYTKPRRKPRQKKIIIKLYTDHNIWWVERYYASKSLVFKGCFPFKVKQHGQQQLYAQYKISWVPYKMVGASLFSQPYLCIQPLL